MMQSGLYSSTLGYILNAFHDPEYNLSVAWRSLAFDPKEKELGLYDYYFYLTDNNTGPGRPAADL